MRNARFAFVGDVLEAPETPETPETPERPASPEKPRARRRGRTTLLIVGAAVLGVVAGTCTGYLIQADREPTALPSLSQPEIQQAKGDVEPLSAVQDRRVKTDGDLRKLLVPRPKGAKDDPLGMGPDGDWMSLEVYADRYTEPSSTLSALASDEFRRVATASWMEGRTRTVQVTLVQFRQEEKPAAAEWAANGRHWAEEKKHTESRPLAGTAEGNGVVYVHHDPDDGIYDAEAHAWRGDIYMEIRLWDIKPVTKDRIMDLAQQQLGKL